MHFETAKLQFELKWMAAAHSNFVHYLIPSAVIYFHDIWALLLLQLM